MTVEVVAICDNLVDVISGYMSHKVACGYSMRHKVIGMCDEWSAVVYDYVDYRTNLGGITQPPKPCASPLLLHF